MALTPFQLQDALRAVGVARVFVGDPFTANGMLPLGATEGDIEVNIPEELNTLTAPELTGGIAHQATVTLGEVTLVVPLIMGDPALWAKVSAFGSGTGGGHSIPQNVVTTSVAFVPLSELGGGLSYDGTTWARLAGNGVAAATGVTAEPQNAIWLWRAVPSNPGFRSRYEDGGKVIQDITFTAMWSQNAGVPEGHKVYTRGNPVARGITTLRI
jgi:hypothetical protein